MDNIEMVDVDVESLYPTVVEDILKPVKIQQYIVNNVMKSKIWDKNGFNFRVYLRPDCSVEVEIEESGYASDYIINEDIKRIKKYFKDSFGIKIYRSEQVPVGLITVSWKKFKLTSKPMTRKQYDRLYTLTYLKEPD